MTESQHRDQLGKINRALIEPGQAGPRDMVQHSYSCCLAAAGFVLIAAGYGSDSGLPGDLAKRMALAAGDAMMKVLNEHIASAN